jgi:hypothetical protein
MSGTQPIFLANYNKGTRILSKTEVNAFAKDFVPESIYRFNGNKLQRTSAVKRALDMKDIGSYYLILNNCQHYTNAIQLSTHETEVEVLGRGLLVTGLITAAASKKEDVQGLGLFAAFLGLMTLAMED